MNKAAVFLDCPNLRTGGCYVATAVYGSYPTAPRSGRSAASATKARDDPLRSAVHTLLLRDKPAYGAAVRRENGGSADSGGSGSTGS